MTTINIDRIREIAGVVGAREFSDAPESSKADLAAWIEALPSLSDDELMQEAQGAILDSAIMQRFRGNHEDIHCRATACASESRSRAKDAGHDEWCADSIYQRAYNAVVRSQGHTGMVGKTDCTCKTQ